MEDIGAWFTVYQAIGFLAVIINATMITFVGQQMAETDEERLGGLAERMENWSLWAIAVAIEHSGARAETDSPAAHRPLSLYLSVSVSLSLCLSLWICGGWLPAGSPCSCYRLFNASYSDALPDFAHVDCPYHAALVGKCTR